MEQEQLLKSLTLVVDQPDFRAYIPEAVDNGKGGTIMMQLCEDLVEGRWEPFFSVVAAR